MSDKDTIYRQDAIRDIHSMDVCVIYDDACSTEEAVEKAIVATKRTAIFGLECMPSAEPRKKGKWDFMGWQMFQCSECKHMFTQDFLEGWKEYTYESHFPPFCPNCGADMREGEEE